MTTWRPIPAWRTWHGWRTVAVWLLPGACAVAIVVRLWYWGR